MAVADRFIALAEDGGVFAEILVLRQQLALLQPPATLTVGSTLELLSKALFLDSTWSFSEICVLASLECTSCFYMWSALLKVIALPAWRLLFIVAGFISPLLWNAVCGRTNSVVIL